MNTKNFFTMLKRTLPCYRLLRLQTVIPNNGFSTVHCLCGQRYERILHVRAHSTQTDHKRQRAVIETTTPKIVIENDRLTKTLKEVQNSKLEVWKLQIDPYVKLMRLDKPIGIYLLYWPCTWSISLGAITSGAPLATSSELLLLFLSGAVLMRGAGCVANDLMDRDIDGQVERTKNRPLVSGAISTKQAVGFLAAQLSASLAILLQLNWYSVALGASSLVLVFTYPLAKRFTNYPQLVLGATFNWGALLGYSAVTGHLAAGAAPLYLAATSWTVLYDTIYAHQDKIDDARLGIKSTALTFAKYTKPALYVVAGTSMALFGVTGAMFELAWPYYVGLGAASAHAFNQIYTLNPDNPEDCARKFKSNTWIGFIIFAGIVAGGYEKYFENRRKIENKIEGSLIES